MTDQSTAFKTIGMVESCFKQKFSIPRQPGIAPDATGKITFIPPWNQQELFRGLDAFSHIWVHFIFHATQEEGWKPTVRPPRMGGKKRLGVFATRSMHRPNALGSSVVKLEKIEHSEHNGVILHISGIDLLDGTPVVDIKPYLPYSDCRSEATNSIAQFAFDKAPLRVNFCNDTESFCQQYRSQTARDLCSLIRQTLEQDPRPAYLKNTRQKIFYMRFWDTNIGWTVDNNTTANVLHIDLVPS